MTLSRGGVFAAIIVIIAFLFVFYFRSSFKQKQHIIGSLVIISFVAVATWTISSYQTSGLLDNRYTNRDAIGREKEDITTGRVDLFVDEFQGFMSNPFFGVGANGMKQSRLVDLGTVVASHNEISRLLSEHGILGIIILLILIFKPLDYRTQNKNNIMFYAFLAFWFATINHSAMRIAAPGFIYGLSLLNVTNEKRPLHRKQIKN